LVAYLVAKMAGLLAGRRAELRVDDLAEVKAASTVVHWVERSVARTADRKVVQWVDWTAACSVDSLVGQRAVKLAARLAVTLAAVTAEPSVDTTEWRWAAQTVAE
jgi:hypothetical protein